MNLPPGYELDAPANAAPSVPQGYELDAPPTDEGAIAAAARGALRNFPGAQQLAAAAAPINPFSEKPTYSAELQHLTDAAEASKAAHPYAYTAGATAGTLAPLAVPGAGEALEAAPILGNAALGAVQSASDVNLTKPTGKDLASAAVGAGLGAGAGALSKGIQAVAPTAEELAANSTAKGFGATARNVGKIMGDDPNAQLRELGEWANRVSTQEGEPLVSLASRPGKMLKALNSIHDDAGEALGSVIKEVAPKAPVNVAQLKEGLHPILEEVQDLNPQAETKIAGIFKRLDGLQKKGNLDFESLQKLKSHIGANIGDEPAMQRAYGVFAEYMDKVIDGYSKLIKDPKLYESFDSARVDYRNASRLLPILKRAEGRELAQGPAGNGGLLGLFGLASGVAGGHPAAGAAAMPINAVARPIANMVGRNAALKAVPRMGEIAAAGRGLNKAAALELENALQSKFGQKEK